jgi:hypothetical protein
VRSRNQRRARIEDLALPELWRRKCACEQYRALNPPSTPAFALVCLPEPEPLPITWSRASHYQVGNGLMAHSGLVLERRWGVKPDASGYYPPAADPSMTRLQQFANFDGDLQHNLRIHRGLPRCHGCGTRLDIDACRLGAHAGGSLACACGAENRVAVPNAWVRKAMPQVTRVVCEQEDLTLAYRQQPFKHAISINRDGCGAPLTLERLERHVRCGYCSA